MNALQAIPRNPLPMVEYADHKQPFATARRVTCPRCEKVFVESAVVTHAHEYEPEACGHFVLRQLYCDHCDHIVCWKQPCDENGHIISRLAVDTGFIKCAKKIAKFLTRFPQAAGVMQF